MGWLHLGVFATVCGSGPCLEGGFEWERACPRTGVPLTPAPPRRPPVLRLTRTGPRCPRIAGSHGLPAHSVRVFFAAAQGDAGAGPGIVPASGKAAATGWHWPLCGSEPCSRTLASEASAVSGEGAERVRGQARSHRAVWERAHSCGSVPVGIKALPANVAQKVKRAQRPRGGGSAKRQKRPAPSEPGDRGSWRNEGTQDGCGSAAERSPPPRG
jgi:hypothetical protein